MKYSYEDLSHTQFENLIILICQRLFGAGVQGFSEGPDGGRDAKFIGTAELHPSSASPWKGQTIIQGKHTNGHNRHFAELDFYNPKSEATTLGEEIPRIKRLRDAKELDNYMIVANRRLAGGVESKIRTYISQSCGLPLESIAIVGVEQLEIWLKRFPQVADEAELDPIDSPLIVSPEELAEVVQAIADAKDQIVKIVDDPPKPRVTYEEKNKLNNMTASYAKAQRDKYLKETRQIAVFLAAPENEELLQLYNSVADEFQLKIISKRKYHQTFDEIMEYLAKLLFDRDPILKQRKHRRITRVVLFFMYWNCDIAEVENVAAD